MAAIGAISGYGISAAYAQSYYANLAAFRAHSANPGRAETPVEPVSRVQRLPQDVPITQPVPAAAETRLPTASALNNAADNLARMRIEYTAGGAPETAEPLSAQTPPAAAPAAPDALETLARMRIEYAAPGLSPQDGAGDALSSEPKIGEGDGKTVAEIFEEEECQTCKERKYQDGSDDPGVSFKTPTGVAPELAASAVRGHEQEHVTRERAKAEREGREVVSQSVVYHTGICPECGRVYVSGGETTTVTAKESPLPDTEEEDGEDQQSPEAA